MPPAIGNTSAETMASRRRQSEVPSVQGDTSKPWTREPLVGLRTHPGVKGSMIMAPLASHLGPRSGVRIYLRQFLVSFIALGTVMLLGQLMTIVDFDFKVRYRTTCAQSMLNTMSQTSKPSTQ